MLSQPCTQIFYNTISNLRSGLKQASSHVLSRLIRRHQNRASEVPSFPLLWGGVYKAQIRKYILAHIKRKNMKILDFTRIGNQRVPSPGSSFAFHTRKPKTRVPNSLLRTPTPSGSQDSAVSHECCRSAWLLSILKSGWQGSAGPAEHSRWYILSRGKSSTDLYLGPITVKMGKCGVRLCYFWSVFSCHSVLFISQFCVRTPASLPPRFTVD